MDEIEIAELSAAESEARLAGLTALLLDAVAGGASVNFLADLKPEAAEAFWRSMLASIPRGETLLFAALRGQHVLGVLLLHPAGKPNQPHRADVTKMLVHRSARRQGLATRLMDAMETRALQLGRTLLTLDTASGSDAEPLYLRRGYQSIGAIPGYSLTTDGRLESAVFFYKQLAPAAAG